MDNFVYFNLYIFMEFKVVCVFFDNNKCVIGVEYRLSVEYQFVGFSIMVNFKKQVKVRRFVVVFCGVIGSFLVFEWFGIGNCIVFEWVKIFV